MFKTSNTNEIEVNDENVKLSIILVHSFWEKHGTSKSGKILILIQTVLHAKPAESV